MIIKDFKLGEIINSYHYRDSLLVLLSGKLLLINSSESQLFSEPQVIRPKDKKEYFHKKLFLSLENTQIGLLPKELASESNISSNLELKMLDHVDYKSNLKALNSTEENLINLAIKQSAIEYTNNNNQQCENYFDSNQQISFDFIQK
ncbi:MAG: hypothetical protein KGN31_00400 [Betaproteobacteria bacterium]|nr:hypothetical protein [Betaproteobacteria bacterium]